MHSLFNSARLERLSGWGAAGSFVFASIAFESTLQIGPREEALLDEFFLNGLPYINLCVW